MAIRTPYIALRDLYLHCLNGPIYITPSSATKIEFLFATNVIQIHYFGRQPDATVNARHIPDGIQKLLLGKAAALLRVTGLLSPFL